MNLTEMQNHFYLYVDDVPMERYTTANTNRLINRGQEEAQKRVDAVDEEFFRSCFNCNVVPSTTSLEFALPADFKKLISAERVVTNGPPVPADWVPFPRRHLEYGTALLSSFLQPAPYCYISGSMLGVINPADTYNLVVWYVQRLPDLSSGTDTSAIPAEYHNFICLHAARLGMIAEGRSFDAWEREYQAELAGIQTFLPPREAQTPRQINYVME